MPEEVPTIPTHGVSILVGRIVECGTLHFLFSFFSFFFVRAPPPRPGRTVNSLCSDLTHFYNRSPVLGTKLTLIPSNLFPNEL